MDSNSIALFIIEWWNELAACTTQIEAASMDTWEEYPQCTTLEFPFLGTLSQWNVVNICYWSFLQGDGWACVCTGHGFRSVFPSWLINRFLLIFICTYGVLICTFGALMIPDCGMAHHPFSPDPHLHLWSPYLHLWSTYDPCMRDQLEPEQCLRYCVCLWYW